MIMCTGFRRFVTFLALALIPSTAELLACVCLEAPPPRRALKRASAVFIGEVEAVEADGGGIAQFRPLVVWKGVDMGRASFTVFSARFEGCIFQFQKGETYLVYAYDGPTHFGIDFPHVTNSCTRTKLGTPESEEVTQLPSPSWYRSSEKGAVTVELIPNPTRTQLPLGRARLEP